MKNKIQKIGLGSVQFGMNYGISNKFGQTTSTEILKIINYCKKNKIQIIDTAFGYGQSENLLGENNLNGFKIVTKYLSPRKINISILNQFNNSLSKLNVASLYAFLAHDPIDFIENSSDWQELIDIKSTGLVKKIGFSLNEPFELEKILEKGFVPDLIQIPFNYFDLRFKNLIQRVKKDFKIEVHSRSVFLQGLFFMNPNELNSFFDPIKLELVEFKKNQVNPGASLLAYALNQEFIDHVIIGVNTLEQLEENIFNLTKLNFILEDNQIDIPNDILIPSRWPKS